MSKKLLLIGSVTIHTYNYYNLVKPYFDDILLITDVPRENQSIEKIEYVSFSYKKLSNYYYTICKIRQLCRLFKPDVIHIHQVNSVALYSILALKSFNIPIVLTAWGSDILISPYKSIVLKKIVNYCLNQANVLTADSQYLGNEILKYIPKQKNKLVIANFGIDVKEEYNSTPKENIIYSNRLHKKLYNVDEIIRSFKKLEETGNNNFKLIIGAIGEETDNLKQLVVDLGLTEKVLFVGWLNLQDNLMWYAKSKFYVSIPDSDATSISLLEAMYYGCYPIVSNLPSNHEWITDNINGEFYKKDFNFVFDINQKYLDKASTINKSIIIERGTKSVAFIKFTAVYNSLIKK